MVLPHLLKMQGRPQSQKLSRFKKLNAAHHYEIRHSSRVVYSSSFHSKELFKREVVNRLKTLHSRKRPLYSDVVRSFTSTKSVQGKPTFRESTRSISETSCVNTVNNVEKVSNKYQSRVVRCKQSRKLCTKN